LKDNTWAKCFTNDTYLSNTTSTKLILKFPLELLCGKIPTLHDNLRIFGESGIITTKDKIQASLSNREICCMFVGYIVHNSSDA
jgi:hypothetical protein